MKTCVQARFFRSQALPGNTLCEALPLVKCKLVNERCRMKFKIIMISILCALLFFEARIALCKDSFSELNLPSQESSLSLNEVINRVEERYDVPGFTARFSQESTIKDMNITDTAFGKISVKNPCMMRWEYEKPDRQIIITDGKKLWVYRPDDNQVTIGKFPSFFGDGKGAGFLSDVKLIRKKFSITFGKNRSNYYILKLLPTDKSLDLSLIYLSISRKTFDIVRIVTYNSYGDETGIEMSDIHFTQKPDDSMFDFEIPEGVDIIELDG